MAQFEYKVVPAPVRGEKVKGVKLPEARFAHTLEGVLNEMARDGWEFVRAELLPSEERAGLSRTSKEWRNLLIFRRAAAGAMAGVSAAAVSAPTGVASAPEMEPIVPRVEDSGPPPRANTPPVRANTPENRARALARQVRGPVDDDPLDDDPDGLDGPFEIKSVDEAAEESPFKSWRERS